MSWKETEEMEERLSSFKALTTSDGWGLLKEVLESQIEVRRQLEDAHEIEDFHKDILELARLKAERRALMLVLELPATLIGQLEEDLQETYNGEPDAT